MKINVSKTKVELEKKAAFSAADNIKKTVQE